MVGGTALSGGVGGILATIAGVLFITELTSFTNMLRISSGIQQILFGAIIALSVVAYRLVLGRAARA